MSLFLYPIIPGVILGTLNWLYWKKQGYTNVGQLVLGILVFYALSYGVFKYFMQ